MVVVEKNYVTCGKKQMSERYKLSESYAGTNEKESIFSDNLKSCILDNEIFLFVWNKIIKRKFIGDNKVSFWAGCTHGEDSLFIYQLLLQNPRIYITDLALYNQVRDRESSVTHIEPQKFVMQLQKMKECFLQIRIDTNNEYSVSLHDYFLDFILHLYLNQWKYCYFSEYKDEYLKIIREVLSYCKFDVEYTYGNFIKQHLLLAKLHLSWVYWKIIFPAGRCFMAQFCRRVKRIILNP